MWDAAAALTPPPHEHREALRKAWHGQHRTDPGPPAPASSQASGLAQVVPVPQAPPSHPARWAVPEPAVESLPADSEPVVLAGPGPVQAPEASPAPTGGHEDPGVPREKGLGWPPEQAGPAAWQFIDDHGQRPWAPSDVSPAQQQVLTLLHDGSVTIADVLASRDSAAHVTDVRLMLEAARSLGPDTAAALIGQAGIEAGSRVRDLSNVQRERLLKAVHVRAPFHSRGSRADAGARMERRTRDFRR